MGGNGEPWINQSQFDGNTATKSNRLVKKEVCIPEKIAFRKNNYRKIE